MTAFVVLALSLTVSAVAIAVVPLLRARDGDTAPVSATALALLIPAAVLAMYFAVSNHDWAAAPVARPASDAAPDMRSAIANLETRLRTQPDDLDNWILLGNAYIQVQQFGAARNAFSRALEIRDDRRARLGFAEATVLEDRGALAGEAGRVFEQVLEAEPLNAKALFYAGMAALAREENDLVRQRWGRLLDLSPPDNVRRILEQQLALLEPDGAGVAPVAAAIQVAVDIAPALRAQVTSGDSLFVLARVPDQPGPPIAAVRLTVDSFPFKTEITDADVMLPGRSLDDAERLEIVARVSKSGDAISRPGDVFGEVVVERRAGTSAQAAVVLDSVVDGS